MTMFLLLALFGSDADPMPKFSCKLRKNADRFEATVNRDGVVWKITCPSGIGGAVVDLTAGQAPERITIRLAGLKNLESVTIRDGTVNLSSRLERGGGKRVLYFDDKGKPLPDARGSLGSLTVEQGKDGIDVTLASRKPGKQWTLAWINEYRN